jgi:acyl-CoA thioesterase-1
MSIPRPRQVRPGGYEVFVNRFFKTLVLVLLLIPAAGSTAIAQTQQPIVITAFGDSLTAGYGLTAGQAFPARLEAALIKRGHKVRLVNAGVSGDTTTAGLSRLNWSVPKDTKAVILELGANDALRGISPKQTRASLASILKSLKQKDIPVLMAGMLAPPNLGPDYGRGFNRIFPELARQYQVVFYPFFLKGVAADATLNQADGIHPNARGVEVLVKNILPAVERLLARVKAAN